MKPLLAILLLSPLFTLAQVTCPPNISFESGKFEFWQRYTGNIAPGGGLLIAPGNGNQQLFSIQNFIAKDPYGDFPIASPDGSTHCVKIGHDLPDTKADRLIYTFSVPANSTNFSILFSYAVVLQNADHDAPDQPRFTVKVFNETKAEYIECSSFDFVAGFSQPDFLISEKDRNVSYKPWTSASINLGAYAGDQLRLEFTANDCSEGGHFGYAYFDVMEKCSNSITGNIICAGADNVSLRAPEGFNNYYWYTGNFSDSLAAGIVYTATQPKIGDLFAVVLEPYSYLGCRDTFYTTITSLSDSIELRVQDTVNGCGNEGFDLTKPTLTQGSSPSLSFEYYLDPNGTIPVSNPTNVQTTGEYFIQAINDAGCTETRSIVINLSSPPTFEVKQPESVAYPQTVNITNAANNPDLTYSYWHDEQLITPVQSPVQIKESGVYYIKGMNSGGCFSVATVEVKVKPLVSIPNSFSPNGDGRNDRFVYNAAGKFKELTFFKIYNRWGQEVFNTTNLSASWDGTFKGKPVENGTYIWILKATDWLNNIYTSKGTLTLIR